MLISHWSVLCTKATVGLLKATIICIKFFGLCLRQIKWNAYRVTISYSQLSRYMTLYPKTRPVMLCNCIIWAHSNDSCSLDATQAANHMVFLPFFFRRQGGFFLSYQLPIYLKQLLLKKQKALWIHFLGSYTGSCPPDRILYRTLSTS